VVKHTGIIKANVSFICDHLLPRNLSIHTLFMFVLGEHIKLSHIRSLKLITHSFQLFNGLQLFWVNDSVVNQSKSGELTKKIVDDFWKTMGLRYEIFSKHDGRNLRNKEPHNTA
jgi:hypothetical protein